MKCPVCKTVELADAELDSGLPSQRCTKCGGQWVGQDAYFNWVGSQGPNLPERAPAGDVELVTGVESAKAKLCPNCGRFLTRARVGRGVNFHLDRCYTCGGIWFDADEWQSLKDRNLHDDVHFVFSAAWQAEVQRRDRDAQLERRMAQKLGEADWAEVKRIRAWLDAHPKRSELYAALTHDVEPQATRGTAAAPQA